MCDGGGVGLIAEAVFVQAHERQLKTCAGGGEALLLSLCCVAVSLPFVLFQYFGYRRRTHTTITITSTICMALTPHLVFVICGRAVRKLATALVVLP